MSVATLTQKFGVWFCLASSSCPYDWRKIS